MTKPPVPLNEEARLEALQHCGILDTAPEKDFDNITAAAASICQVPICVLSFIDRDRQWFKSSVGLAFGATSREVSFCSHAILKTDLFVVEDAQADPRFAQNPLVTGEPKVRFYAGMPLITRAGHALGTLCIMDRVPRRLTPEQKEQLRALAASTVMLLEARRK